MRWRLLRWQAARWARSPRRDAAQRRRAAAAVAWLQALEDVGRVIEAAVDLGRDYCDRPDLSGLVEQGRTILAAVDL